MYLKDPTVIVKLISFKYSVLGEVNRPGIYTNFNNQLTVLEAISQAGDISPFGERRKVMVIRPGWMAPKPTVSTLLIKPFWFPTVFSVA